MAKTMRGNVISNKMQNTIIVEVTRRMPHPLYRKLLKRSKKFKVETRGEMVEVGTKVTIQETKPISKDKHFVLVKSTKEKEAKK